MELTEDLLERWGKFYTHPLSQLIHPELKDITFEEFVEKQLRRLEYREKVREYILS